MTSTAVPAFLLRTSNLVRAGGLNQRYACRHHRRDPAGRRRIEKLWQQSAALGDVHVRNVSMPVDRSNRLLSEWV